MIANRPLNYQAIALEEAETEIRIIVKNDYFNRTPRNITNEKIRRVIISALKKIRIPDLRDAAKESLLSFYNRQYKEISLLSPTSAVIMSALFSYLSGEKRQVLRAKNILLNNGIRIVSGKVDYKLGGKFGVPMQKFSADYFRENVKPVYDRLLKQQSMDPADISGRNTLRNRAEMEVRYNEHLEEIDRLKKSGTKLVIVSTHSDCSERCAPYQGKVFSLDGTSGTTEDGRKYVPLEVATDVWYTTKAGKRYKNGLLGFNCRHFLVPYKNGFRFEEPNAELERKEYAITIKQRALERNVRKWRDIAIQYKNSGDRNAYLEARRKAIEWNKEYIEYSKNNNRAYYPSRTKVI